MSSAASRLNTLRKTAPHLVAQMTRESHEAARAKAAEKNPAPDPVLLAEVAKDGTIIRPARIIQADWIDPDDLNPNRREAKRVRGFRVVHPLQTLHENNPREITVGHMNAAKRLIGDYELSEGARSGGDAEKVDCQPSGGGPTIAQIDALKRFREACAALGNQAQFVLPVVLMGWTLERLGEACAMNRHRVHGRLAAGLDMLHEHYFPNGERATIVPAMVIDTLVVDIPQERLGRAKRC